MGACVSSHKKSSAVKNMSSGSGRKNDDNNNVVIVDSPIKENVMVLNGNVAVKPQWSLVNNNSRDFAAVSKDETFFDSQAWLDSDCESEFMSVNGEFTPSRNNTPLHHGGTPPVKGGLPIFPAGTPPMKAGGPVINDDKSSTTPSHPSPIKKKKRLSELFRESIREDHSLDEENGEPTKENGASGSLKGATSRAIGSKSKRERWVEIVQVNNCLPRVLSSCRPVTHQQTQVRR